MTENEIEDHTGFHVVYRDGQLGPSVTESALNALAVQEFSRTKLPAWATEVHELIDQEGLYLEEYDPIEVLDFAVYRKRLEPWCRPYADAWYGQITKLKRQGISCSAVWRFEAAMRRDVHDTCNSLKDASPNVRAAWAGWYVPWVRSEIQRMIDAAPWLGQPAEVRYAERKRKAKQRQTKQREQQLDKRLLDHVVAQGGSVVWSPDHLRKQLSSSKRPYTLAALEASVKRLGDLGLIRRTHRPRSYTRGHLSRLVLLAENASESYEMHCKPLKFLN